MTRHPVLYLTLRGHRPAQLDFSNDLRATGETGPRTCMLRRHAMSRFPGPSGPQALHPPTTKTCRSRFWRFGLRGLAGEQSGFPHIMQADRHQSLSRPHRRCKATHMIIPHHRSGRYDSATPSLAQDKMTFLLLTGLSTRSWQHRCRKLGLFRRSRLEVEIIGLLRSSAPPKLAQAAEATCIKLSPSQQFACRGKVCHLIRLS